MHAEFRGSSIAPRGVMQGFRPFARLSPVYSSYIYIYLFIYLFKDTVYYHRSQGPIPMIPALVMAHAGWYLANLLAVNSTFQILGFL